MEMEPGSNEVVTTALVRYDDLAVVVDEQDEGDVAYRAMNDAIDRCERVPEAKSVHDRARALQGYYRRARNLQAERKCALIRLLAAHRAGTLLKVMEKRGERATRGSAGGRGDRKFPTGTFKLADLGVSKKESCEWQQLAAYPWEDIENLIYGNPEISMSVSSILTHFQEVREMFERIKFKSIYNCDKCKFRWDYDQTTCPVCGGPAFTNNRLPPLPKEKDTDVRIVWLMFRAPRWREFRAIEKALRARYGTKNETETVMAALRNEIAREPNGSNIVDENSRQVAAQ